MITANILDHLQRKSVAFSQFWIDLDAKRVQLSEQTREKFHQWQLLLRQSRTTLAELPKEIRKRELFKKQLKDLQEFEDRVSVLLENWRTQKAEKLALYAEQARAQAQIISDRFAEIRKNPVLLRLQEGKKVLASRKQFQWGRKIFHTGNGLLGLYLYAFTPIARMGAIITLICYLAVALSIEIGRFNSPRFNEWLSRRISAIMREKERHQISAGTWFMLAMLFVLLFFPKEVVIAVLLFTSLGDTAAGTVGSLWGRIKLSPHVSLEGLLAGFAVNFAAVYLFVLNDWMGNLHLVGLSAFLFSFLASLIGTLAEGAFKDLEDNFVIPMLSAPVTWLLLQMFS